MTNSDEFKVLLDRLDSIQRTVDRVDRDLTADRRDLQEFQLRLGALEGEVRQLKEMVFKMPITVGDQVSDVTREVTKETKELKEAVQEKKGIKLNIIHKAWWKRMFW